MKQNILAILRNLNAYTQAYKKKSNLLVVCPCSFRFCSRCRTATFRDGALGASDLVKGNPIESEPNVKTAHCRWPRAHHANVNDLSRSLHGDNLKLTQAVLKLRGKNGNVSISRKFVHLCRNVGSRCFSQAVVEEQLAACLFTALTLPFLPSLNEWQLNDIIVRLDHFYLWSYTTYLVHT